MLLSSYQLEEDVDYIVYPYEHPFDGTQRIELGIGKSYYIYKDLEPYLTVTVDGLPFTEAILFHDCLAIGNYNKGVYFINLHDFEIKNIEVQDYFGYFVDDRDILYVLGCCYIMAFNSHLELLWKTDNLAIDGVVFKYIEGNTMTVSCEMDPPGGWIDRKISLLDGSVIEW